MLSILAPVLKSTQGLELEVMENWQGLAPTTIFALGKEPLEFLGEQKVVPKGRKTTSLRGQVFRYLGANVMMSYSPGIVNMDYRHYVDLLTDFSQVIRLHQTGKNEPEYGDYRFVPDFTDAINCINEDFETTGRKVDVALDLETVGLDPYLLPTLIHPGAFIVTIQLTYRRGKSDVVYFHGRTEEEARLSCFEFAQQMAWLLSSKKISMRGANLKYDLHWLAVRGQFECTNFQFDTTLVGSLLDENRSNGLDVHAKIYVPRLAGYSDTFDQKTDKSRMDLVDKQQVLTYGGGDTDATMEVSIVEKAELLKDPALTSFYINILHPAARAFEMVERGGILVDREAYRELEADLQKEAAELVYKAKQIVGGRIVAKHADADKVGGMNLTKPSMLEDFMFSPMGLNLKPKMWTAGGKEGTGKKAPSTSLDHMKMFADVPEAAEFVALLSNYSSTSKTLSTYVTGFLKHLRSDGRYHPSYYFFAGNKDEGEGGTNTGRLSCRDPAFQTLPKHTKWAKALRRCFPAPPGYLVMERDYSQGELRVVACIANELNMIEAYRKGMDLHAATSGRFAGYSYEEMMELKKADKDKYDSLRQLGKAGNFGLLYGMGVDGFHAYAMNNYGVKDLTLEGAGQFRNGFFETYPGLVEYHKNYKAMAKQHGQVYSPLGRIRHLPMINSQNQQERALAERQSINAPVQSTLSDLLIWAIAEEHTMGLSAIAPSFGACHDAAYSYLPEDNVDALVQQHIDVMENLPFHKIGWNPQLKFIADAKIGPDMASLKDWKGK